MLALTIAGLLVIANVASIVIAGFRIRAMHGLGAYAGSVTVLRPVCGIDHFEEETLSSTFTLHYPNIQMIFCARSECDRDAQMVKELIEHEPQAQLLIGLDELYDNPKLNNLAKGWRASEGRWVVMADSNVLLPPDAVSRLLYRWGPTAGLVCSPPLGERPIGFWAEVECAFLNTYQARWQYFIEAFGFGFAQGKVLLWNKPMLDSWGGIEALASDIAEDAAATKLVRGNGKQVQLVDAPFPQLLGYRTFREVFDRQARWARLRRKTFPVAFTVELLSTAIIPVLLLTQGPSAFVAVSCATVIWYAAEVALAWRKGWHLSWWMPLAFAVRDFLILWIYILAWATNRFVWRGTPMTVKEQ